MLICWVWSTNTTFPVCWKKRLSSIQRGSERRRTAQPATTSYRVIISNWGENRTPRYFSKGSTTAAGREPQVFLGKVRTWAGFPKKPPRGDINSSEAEGSGILLGSAGVFLSPLHRSLRVTNADGYSLLAWLYGGGLKRVQRENGDKQDFSPGVDGWQKASSKVWIRADGFYSAPTVR